MFDEDKIKKQTQNGQQEYACIPNIVYEQSKNRNFFQEKLMNKDIKRSADQG
jgi:hypothetical protein